MKDLEVKNPLMALVYMCEVNLNNVEIMANKSYFTKWELYRLIDIAQKSMNWCIKFDIDLSSVKMAQLIIKNHNGSVKKWAESIISNKKKRS